ncbi:FG-GAP repeat protein [Patescibacteria group bacterium]|nr:FG-GAP repeat protein [Patescibacteria group bacterium]MDL1953346.1 hypothetical protein [Candidatus Uhrbacteria bacterium UHB]
MKRTAIIGPLLLLALFVSGMPPVRAAAIRPVPVRPEHARTAEVSLWRSAFTERQRFSTFEAAHVQGAFLAAGDMDGDGVEELIVGAGPNRSPEVRIYSSGGELLKSFRAYPEWFKGGVRVAAGDMDGDGKTEIVTAPGPGIAPQINIFNAEGIQVLKGGAHAYQKEFQGGAHVAVYDLNGDGKAEIVTAPGPGGGPHVRIFNEDMQNLGMDFFAFDENMRDGITLAIMRTPSGPQIVVGIESWQKPFVRRFLPVDGGAELQKEFQPFPDSWRAGVTLAAYDFDGDGVDELAIAGNGGTPPEVRIVDMFGTPFGAYLLHDPTYRGGLSMAQITRAGGGKELATVAVAPVVVSPRMEEKFIEVNLTEQRLYAYERGRIARTFLISSGLKKYPTPELETTVLEKIFVKDYKWIYGPGNPDNYFLPNVKYNLRIFGPFYIHYAYWHNNFGYRMSHGCINAGKADAEWIYNWADVGTPVITHS